MTDATAIDPDDLSDRLMLLVNSEPTVAGNMASCMIAIVYILAEVFEAIQQGKHDDPMVMAIVNVCHELGLVNVTAVEVDVVGGGDVTNEVETSKALDQAWAAFQEEFGTEDVEGLP